MRSVGDSAVSLVLVLTAASSLFSMVGLFQIDRMINQDLYRFGLIFSYAWATPYWTAMKFVFAIGWFNILVAIGFHFYMILQRKKESKETAAQVEKEISQQEIKPTEKVEEPEQKAVKPPEIVEMEEKETQVSVTEAEKKEETQTAVAEASSQEQLPSEQLEQVEEKKEQKLESPAESEADQKQVPNETQETSEETPIIIGVPEEEPQPTP
jgi:hypothetical protein